MFVIYDISHIYMLVMQTSYFSALLVKYYLEPARFTKNSVAICAQMLSYDDSIFSNWKSKRKC